MTVTQKEFREELAKFSREEQQIRHENNNKTQTLLMSIGEKIDDLKDFMQTNHEQVALMKQDLGNHKKEFNSFKTEVKQDISDIKNENEGVKKIIRKVGGIISVISVIAATLVPYLIGKFG